MNFSKILLCVLMCGAGCKPQRDKTLEAPAQCQHGYGLWGPAVLTSKRLGGYPQYRYCTNCGIADMRLTP